MSSFSTFGTFTTARLGIFAAQKGLDVTGHNITNINTKGYSRQSLNQVSLHVGSYDRYQPINDANVGNGVLCTSVSQMRDPYLDIRYRSEQSNVGSTSAKLTGLEDISSILDEVGKGQENGVIERQFNDLITQLEYLNTGGAGQQDYDSRVRSSATTLVHLFNSYSNKLDEIEQNQITGFKQDLDHVNTLLENIRDLNASIRRSEIHRDQALEQRDQRNLLLDELSEYIKIDVSYGTEDIGGGQTVERLIVKLAGTNPKPTDPRTDQSTLVDGIFAGQLNIQQLPVPNPDFDSTIADGDTNPRYLDSDGNKTNNPDDADTMNDPKFNLVLSALSDAKGKDLSGSSNVDLADNDLFGALQSTREILTEKGEYSTSADTTADPLAATKRGIPYYKKSLDAIANKFAAILNEANTIPDDDLYRKDATGVFLLDGDGNKILKPGYANYQGGTLFSNANTGDNAENITAGNISISKSWSNGKTWILASKAENPASQDSSNIAHILTLMGSKFEYKHSDIAPGESEAVYFKGTFQEMLSSVSSTLANDKNTTATLLDNFSYSADELYSNRDSVSGVDLNDEAASLMQYQKSYAAACRLMTTIDEALDKLINGTGVVGR